MSRAIKYRAWDTFQKTYVFEGFHVIGEVTVFGGIDSVISDTREARFAALGYQSSIEAWDDFILEQWTGLVDKTGRDIYEGDIIQSFLSGDPNPSDSDTPEQVWTVSYASDDHLGAGFYAQHSDQERVTSSIPLSLYRPLYTSPQCRFFSVLGNIHQNVDLLAASVNTL